MKFRYSSESDHVRYPLGSDTKIEGGKNASGDRHAIVVDKATCRDYETWRHPQHQPWLDRRFGRRLVARQQQAHV